MRDRDDLERRGVDRRIILKCKLKKIRLGPGLD
jgi:hypothetical protein